MASNSETGHSKNVANFLTLIGVCQSFGTKYNPVKNALKTTALTTQHTTAATSVSDLHTAETDLDKASNSREIIFSQIKPLTTRIKGALEATDATQQSVDDVQTVIRKIKGKKVPKVKAGAELGSANKTENPEGTAEPVLTPTEISSSQQSYDMLVDHFDRLLKYLSAETLYTPNETELKVAALTTLHTDLKAKNKSVSDALTAYNNKKIERDQILYDKKTGLVETAKEVKKYVLSIYGATSPKYKQVSSIPFRNLVKL